MNIILSNTDSAPIYEQITRQLRAKIVSGELAAGQALPSMRLLARELRISVITTKRAYEELEREGLIVTQTCCRFYACNFQKYRHQLFIGNG